MTIDDRDMHNKIKNIFVYKIECELLTEIFICYINLEWEKMSLNYNRNNNFKKLFLGVYNNVQFAL